MKPVTALGVFCDDIREEKSGMDTLVGVFSDNLSVPSVPGTLPKLGLYVRVQLAPTGNTGRLSIRLEFPDGTRLLTTEFDQELVDRARREALEDGAPFAGLISRAVMAPFPLKAPGRIKAVLTAGDEDHVCAVLNIKVSPQSEEPQRLLKRKSSS